MKLIKKFKVRETNNKSCQKVGRMNTRVYNQYGTNNYDSKKFSYNIKNKRH